MLRGVFADPSKFSTVTCLLLRSLGGWDVLNSDLLERLQCTTIASHYPTSASSAFLCLFSFWGGDEDAVAQLTSPKMNQTTPDNLFYSNIRNGGVLLGCSHHICSTPQPFLHKKKRTKGSFICRSCAFQYLWLKSPLHQTNRERILIVGMEWERTSFVSPCQKNSLDRTGHHDHLPLHQNKLKWENTVVGHHGDLPYTL